MDLPTLLACAREQMHTLSGVYGFQSEKKRAESRLNMIWFHQFDLAFSSWSFSADQKKRNGTAVLTVKLI